MPRTSRFVTLVAVVVAATLVPAAGLIAQEVPEGYEQLLERGRIASIDAPEWVTVDEASMPDDAWVLGFVVDGQARAYGINLLNAHEVVNDRVGDTAFAAVW